MEVKKMSYDEFSKLYFVAIKQENRWLKFYNKFDEQLEQLNKLCYWYFTQREGIYWRDNVGIDLKMKVLTCKDAAIQAHRQAVFNYYENIEDAFEDFKFNTDLDRGYEIYKDYIEHVETMQSSVENIKIFNKERIYYAESLKSFHEKLPDHYLYSDLIVEAKNELYSEYMTENESVSIFNFDLFVGSLELPVFELPKYEETPKATKTILRGIKKKLIKVGFKKYEFEFNDEYNHLLSGGIGRMRALKAVETMSDDEIDMLTLIVRNHYIACYQTRYIAYDPTTSDMSLKMEDINNAADRTTTKGFTVIPSWYWLQDVKLKRAKGSILKNRR